MLKKLKKWWEYIVPPEEWKTVVIIISGIFTGLFFLSFHLSNAPSYLSDKPETCINCHVMYSQYASWAHSSHARVATCNDCHVPHDNFFRKYAFKASDGMRHATIFTLRNEPQVIRIREAGIKVVQENCIRCHYPLVKMTDLAGEDEDEEENFSDEQEIYCWHCHRNVPHTRVNSLSSAPNALVPGLPHAVPDWLEQIVKKSK